MTHGMEQQRKKPGTVSVWRLHLQGDPLVLGNLLVLEAQANPKKKKNTTHKSVKLVWFTYHENKVTPDESITVRTLSPGGPGGPSFPELPWTDKIRSLNVNLYRSIFEKVAVKQCAHLWTSFSRWPPRSSLSPRPLEKEKKSLKKPRDTYDLKSLFIVSVWIPFKRTQVEPPRLLRCQARHLYGSTSLLSKTNRWSSLSAWARLSCCSLRTRRTHTMIKGMPLTSLRGRILSRNHSNAGRQRYLQAELGPLGALIVFYNQSGVAFF